MPILQQLTALEILDSRGCPTIQATCRLRERGVGTASVPAGASTGAAECRERRDGDPQRYHGLGCLQAVEGIETEIHPAFAGRDFDGQPEWDFALRELDGTTDKSRLGANALLAVSLAFARACANRDDLPLHRHFSRMWGEPAGRLPRAGTDAKPDADLG